MLNICRCGFAHRFDLVPRRCAQLASLPRTEADQAILMAGGAVLTLPPPIPVQGSHGFLLSDDPPCAECAPPTVKPLYLQSIDALRYWPALQAAFSNDVCSGSQDPGGRTRRRGRRLSVLSSAETLPTVAIWSVSPPQQLEVFPWSSSIKTLDKAGRRSCKCCTATPNIAGHATEERCINCLSHN